MITLTCPDCEAKNVIDDEIHRFACSKCCKTYFVENRNGIVNIKPSEQMSDRRSLNIREVSARNEELRNIETKISKLEKIINRKLDDRPRQPHLPDSRTGLWVGLAIISTVGLIYFAVLEQGIGIYVLILGICTFLAVTGTIKSIRAEKENFEFYENNLIHYEAELEKHESEIACLMHKIKILEEQKEQLLNHDTMQHQYF